jgi:hypothetical protein
MPKYSFAGLLVDSDLELPLPVAGTSEAADGISIQLESPIGDEELLEAKGWHWESPSSARLQYPGLGQAWIRDGRQVVLRPVSDVQGTTEWRGLLIPCFAAVFHQRGVLSLHASAVCGPRGAVGVMGYRGAGKSTLTAQLVSGGMQFMSDDLLITSWVAEPGHVVAHPGFSIIKLWEDALEAAGKGFSRIGRLYPDASKDGFSPDEGNFPSAPVPLRFLVVLAEGDEVKMEALSRADAMAELLMHTYGVAVFEHRPLPIHFRQCGELAARVPVMRLVRPKNFDCVDEVRATIEKAFADNVTGD